MKQFAFPFSVYCDNDEEYKHTFSILKELGYRYNVNCGNEYYRKSHPFIVTCFRAVVNDFGIDCDAFNYDRPRHHIPHFDAALIRDIAAACTNETWQKGELFKKSGIGNYDVINGLTGEPVNPDKWIAFRPTLAEICAHHGYEIKGKVNAKIEASRKNRNNAFTI